MLVDQPAIVVLAAGNGSFEGGHKARPPLLKGVRLRVLHADGICLDIVIDIFSSHGLVIPCPLFTCASSFLGMTRCSVPLSGIQYRSSHFGMTTDSVCCRRSLSLTSC